MSKTLLRSLPLLLLAGALLLACTPASIIPSPPPTFALPSPTPTPIRNTPTPTPSPTATPTPTPLPTATPTPQPRAGQTPTAISYDISEAEINRRLQQQLQNQSDLPVQNLSIDLRPGKIVLLGQVPVGFFKLNAEVTITVSVVNGKAIPEVSDIQVAGQTVGGILEQQITDMIQPYLDQFLNTDLGVDIDAVEISEDNIHITGHVR